MAMEFSMNGMNVKLQAIKENKSKVVSACSAEAVCCSVTTKELEDPVMTAHRKSVL